MKSELISIIIVTWNNDKVIKECLESILKITNPVEVIVVDNQSIDNTVYLIEQYKNRNVTVIQPEKNLGFAKANNLGVLHAHGKYVLLLNPDTILEETDLSKVTRLLNSQVGMVGCRLLNQDRTLQPSCYNFDTPSNIILEQFMLGKLFPESLKRKYTPYLSQHNTPMIVDWLVGAFLILTKADYNSINGFSTEYFMYSEDMDIAYKIHEIGKKVLFTPSYSIIHIGGVSENQDISSSKEEKMFLSRKIFADKYNYPLNMKIFLLSYKLKFGITLIFGFFSNKGKQHKMKYKRTIRLIKKYYGGN